MEERNNQIKSNFLLLTYNDWKFNFSTFSKHILPIKMCHNQIQQPFITISYKLLLEKHRECVSVGLVRELALLSKNFVSSATGPSESIYTTGHCSDTD